MSERRWVEVVGWDRFQHYKDRDPPWIKNYTRLMADDAYLDLTEHRSLMLHRLWLEYASSGCRLPLDTRSLSARLALRVTTADLKALNDAGFIRFSASAPASNLASNLLAPRARARTRSREAETETEGPLTPPAEGPEIDCNVCGEPVQPGQACRHCGANPRAAGSNPRALAEQTDEQKREQRHRELLRAARVLVEDWEGGSDVFDERLDELEREHGGQLSAAERMNLWDTVLAMAAP